MNRLIFEGRFLINMAGSIIRQDTLSPLRGGMDWERMYRTADYHKLANLIYLGLLGKKDHVPERWRENFFKRYQEALRYGELCNEAEKEILILFDMKEVSCIILASCGVRGLYKVKEMAANSPLILYMDNENYTLAKGYLVDLGYETDKTFPGFGERMRKASGLMVEIYHDLPFITKLYKKNMQYLMESAYPKKPYEYIRTLSATDRFSFRMAQAVYHYATDELLIRELLDLCLYHKAWHSQLNQEAIKNILSDLHIDEIAEKLLYISYMWFGSRTDSRSFGPHEDMEVYDVLENRILSRGTINKEADVQVLDLTRLIERELNKEKRKEKIESLKDWFRTHWKNYKRTLRWVFPEYKYMCAVYSWLEKVPVLLPVGWLMRGIRLLTGVIKLK